MDGIQISFIPREQQHSEYDWANIYHNNESVGKARCLIQGDEFTIYSINIYPEYQGHGYGKAFVENAKHIYTKIIADRVRYTAIGFWDTLGFIQDDENNNWIFKR
jgi:GNAT superfamily N-acetyltransferase